MIDPREYAQKGTDKILAVFDSETDPFFERRIPRAFTCGFYRLDTGDYEDFWGDDCIDQFFDHLRGLTEQGLRFAIHCHNFGGFDVHMGMLDRLDPGTSPSIINGRIASCMIEGQEFRDSYRLIPVALSVYNKDEFDYSKMERERREAHKVEILHYQRNDCVYLGELVREFYALFGNRPTMGNVAINKLQAFHGFDRMREGQDNAVRPYFYGGRCQVFKPGISWGAWKVYDVNSMYPSVMRNFRHPLSATLIRGMKVWQGTTAFVEWEGENQGAVPKRLDDGSLDFKPSVGRFWSTIHEYNLGLETGTIRPRRVVQTIGFHEWGDFAEFIDHFYTARMEARQNGDKLRDLFYKLVMNSAYGKFAQDPRRYENYTMSLGGEGIPEDLFDAEEKPNAFRPHFMNGDMIIWSRPSSSRFSGFFNCATGASITGAARAMLWRGILGARKPIYCDTDSIICERLDRVTMDDKELGAWKLEASGEVFASAGKKLYALFSRDPSQAIPERWDNFSPPSVRPVKIGATDFYCVKKASKGVSFTSAEILQVANGLEVEYKSDRPNFTLDGRAEFIDRVIKRTD